MRYIMQVRNLSALEDLDHVVGINDLPEVCNIRQSRKSVQQDKYPIITIITIIVIIVTITIITIIVIIIIIIVIIIVITIITRNVLHVG